MAICANQGRMYMGTARQFKEARDCFQTAEQPTPAHVRMQRRQGTCSCVREADRQTIRTAERRIFTCPEDGCEPQSLCAGLPLAAAYVNPQPYTGLVDPDTALNRGSAFNNLYDPWNPGRHC